MTICRKNASLDRLRSRWSRCKASLRMPRRTSLAIEGCGAGEDWGFASI